MHDHLRVFGIQRTAVFAGEVAEQGAVADFHRIAIEDAQRAAILVVIQGGLAVLEAAVIERGLASLAQADAVPAAATRIEDVESGRVGHGESDGIGFRADGFQRGVVFNNDLEKALENHGRSGQNTQRILHLDITLDEYCFSFPNA